MLPFSSRSIFGMLHVQGVSERLSETEREREKPKEIERDRKQWIEFRNNCWKWWFSCFTYAKARAKTSEMWEGMKGSHIVVGYRIRCMRNVRLFFDVNENFLIDGRTSHVCRWYYLAAKSEECSSCPCSYCVGLRVDSRWGFDFSSILTQMDRVQFVQDEHWRAVITNTTTATWVFDMPEMSFTNTSRDCRYIARKTERRIT